MKSKNWILGFLILSMAACSSQGEHAIAEPEHVGPQSGASSPLTEVSKAALSDVLVDIDSQGIVTFSYLLDGVRVPYVKNYAGDVVAQREGESRYHLWLKRGGDLPHIELGYLDAGTLKICGQFEIDGQQREFDCDAMFLKTPDHSSPGPDGTYSVRLPVIIGHYSDASTPKAANGALVTDNAAYAAEVVDLSGYALNQINQYSTGTCYFNSTTGILEWFYNRQTGGVLDISEPSLVARYSEMDSVNDYNMVAKASNISGMVPDSLIPVLTYYTPSASYNSARQQAASALTQIPSSSRVTLPFNLTVTNLFWYGRYENGHTTEADYQLAANWIVQKRQPVHLQVVVGAYWHAIVMLGYNPSTGEVLIKDSLGQTNLKATWRSKQWFMADSYGAMGVDIVGGSCTPACGGKACGSDGCGGTCGTCPTGQTCSSAGQCVSTCTPSCSGKTCGSNGCGGTCGTCSTGQTCSSAGQCISTCTPSCSGKACGSDGCGGTCGTCPSGQTCNSVGQCDASGGCAHPICSTGTKLTSTCDSCAGTICALDPYCCQVEWDSVCVAEVPSVCGQSCGTCTPACGGKACGSDGCGGTCGTCPSGQTCSISGQCASTGTCPHAICSTGDKLNPGCDPCVAKICAKDQWCCLGSWDSYCVDEVSSVCGKGC
jgi:hypothetical protein